MKEKKVELVLKKIDDSRVWNWELTTIDGKYIDSFCYMEIEKLFNPGDETCLILEITAHPAEWVGGTQ